MTTPRWQPGHLYLTGDLVQPIQASAPVSTALTNPGFETAFLAGWTITAPSGGTASVATDKKFAGTYAGRWQGVSGGAAADWVNDTEVSVKPGQSVSAAIYLSLDDTTSSANQARARLYWYDASHALLSHTDGTLIHGNTSSWYTSAVTGVAPAAAAYARMGAWTSANASGGVRLDSASWSIAAAAAPAGLIYKAVQVGPGTSGSSEPTWPSTLAATVVDNTVTWEAVQASRVVWEASPICKSGTTEPDWPTEVGGFVTDGTISWECISRRVEDEKCPNTTVVAIIASKVFAVDGDIVRFSATANPLDWTSANDAGYLPTGLQQANANDMAVLAPYRGNLVCMNASSFQNWQVDPDPAQMALLDQMEGIGSTWQHAAQPVANDLFFLPQLGVRSVGISAGADNLAAGDIGMPIDVLVRAALADAIANSRAPLATYYPGAGQYWLGFSPAHPSISGATPDTCDDADYNEVLAIAGGTAPFTNVQVVSGEKPAAMSLTIVGSTIVLDGTDMVPGAYSFWITVDDANGVRTTPRHVAFTVHHFEITGTLPDATALTAYSHVLTLSDGVAPYVLGTVTGLPTGGTATVVGDTIVFAWDNSVAATTLTIAGSITDATGCSASFSESVVLNAAFTPSCIVNGLWLRADAPSNTLSLDPLGSGHFYKWTDSCNGYETGTDDYFSEETDTSKGPIAGSINGIRAAFFDADGAGVVGFQAVPSPQPGDYIRQVMKGVVSGYIAAIWRKDAADAVANDSRRVVFWSPEIGGNGNNERLGLTARGSSEPDGVRMRARQDALDTTSSAYDETDHAGEVVFGVAVADWATGTMKLYVNGSLTPTGTGTIASFSGTTSDTAPSNKFWIGSDDQGTGPSNLHIGEIIAQGLGAELSDADRQKIEGYLAWKWQGDTSDTDLVALLPAGHPYKSAAP